MTGTIATLFSGGEGVGVGARAAGYRHLWGIEVTPEVAAVAERNGFSAIVGDVCDVDPGTLERPDVLHASPPCLDASGANGSRIESEGGKALGRAIARYIRVLQPRVFTLENIWFYRTFESFQTIVDALFAEGYMVDWEHLNAADFGGLVKCPIHVSECTTGSVQDAEQRTNLASRMNLAQDIVRVSAMMLPTAQAKHLAWDAAVALVRITPPGTVGNATLQEWAQRLPKNKRGKIIPTGEAVAALTKEVMSKYGITGDMSENIGLLLNASLAGLSETKRWSTTSMEIRKTTILKILECLLTTESTPLTITEQMTSPMDGNQEQSGHSCPLCRYMSVPQTRQRLILRAVRGSLLPPLPAPEPWVGWYEAIEDLIPTLPESRFAPWQLERLPEHPSASALFSNQNSYDQDGGCYGTVYRRSQEPAMTIRKALLNARAFLLHPTADNERFVFREADEPIFTVQAGNHMPRAFVLDSQNAGREDGALTLREQDDPMFTVGNVAKGYPRAFLVGSQYAQPNTVADRRVQTRIDGEPAFSITASDKGDKRAWLSAGRVVQMTPRALARLQTIPDSYELPESRRLACYVIGNAVPPRMYRKIIAQFS